MTSSKSVIPGELADQEQERKRKKRGAIVKFSLAGVALLGIGAAATSAAWTDDAWFSGAAHSLSKSEAVDLRGGLDDYADDDQWTPADENPGASGASDFVTISSADLQNLVAGDEITIPLWVKNFGSRTLDVTADLVASTSTGLFSNTDDVHVSLSADSIAGLVSGTSASVDLVVSIDADAPTTVGDEDGSLTVQFQGTPVLND
jgi:predicted ribosomally synthesized peptide with SipW-like signal peptide